MRRESSICSWALAAVLMSLCLIPAYTSAQSAAGERREEAASRPTPRLPDGHPDLSGVWAGSAPVVVDASGGKHIGIASRSAPKSLDPDGKLARYYLQLDGDKRRAENPNKPPYKEELMAKVKQLDKSENQIDPVVSCHPAGVPRAGVPHQIFATPNYAVFFYTGENSSHYRLIPTNGGAHPTGAYPTYLGDSVGHWEGDTLVLDVTNFNDQTWLGSDGWFHTEAMHVVERFTRQGNVLHYEATVDDPNVFTRTWVMDPRTVTINTEPNNYVFEEFPCMDFDHDHIVNHDHF
jgi:hypothetical protein